MTEPNTTLRLRRAGVVCSELGDEIVILDLDTSAYFSVRKVGATIVEALREGCTSAALTDRVTSTYAVAAPEAAADVAAFLEQLSARNLLEAVP